MSDQTDRPITELLRGSRVLTPEDSLQRAVGLLRASGLPALPVIQGSRVVGMLSEADALDHMVRNGQEQPTNVGEAMKPDQVYANKYMSRGQVADIMATSGAAVLPVIDEYGTYQGLVTRADVIGSMCDALRPPSPAGMATPLGVHLTTGAVRSGPGAPGLFLTGLSLFGLMYSASLVAVGLAFLVDKVSGIPIIAMLESPPIGTFNVLDLPRYLTVGASVVLMMIFLRLSPLSGYHAAEHMVVHAIEIGEPLEPELVRQMPRAHQRCGTNLLAAAAILMLLSTQFSTSTTIMIGLVVVVLGWRTIGGYLQYYVTTRPPSEKQLLNGIKAGKELIEQHRKEPNRIPTSRERILNMGFLQTAAGLMVGYGIDHFIQVLTGFSPIAFLALPM